MKTNFKVLSLAAMALMLGFASCSKDGEGVPDGFKKVTVQMEFPITKTRAMDDVTADQKTPNFVDLTLFFVGNNVVQQVEPIALSGGAALNRSFTVPNAVSKVYAIGNTGAGVVNNEGVGAPTSLPVVGNAETVVKGLAMEVDKQLSYKIVNLSNGQGSGNNGTAYGGATSADVGGTETYTFSVYPAFARYEIKEVSANASATKPLTGFDLTGIFITNTYRTISLDYSTGGSPINYASDEANFASDIPGYLKDILASPGARTSFTPNTFDDTIDATDGFWHYTVSPVIAGQGTSLDGGTTQETSIPIIVLRIENAAGSGSETYASPSYVTIRTLTAASGELANLRPGYVYKIANIAFGGEHLTVKPGESTESDIAVAVTFQPWTGEDVTPGW